LVGGVLIGVTLVLFFGIIFGSLDVQLKYESGWMQMGAATACCGLLIHSFVDFNLHIPANAAWFAFCAGLASLSGRIMPQQEATARAESLKARSEFTSIE
jgi:O-antigen ligase